MNSSREEFFDIADSGFHTLSHFEFMLHLFFRIGSFTITFSLRQQEYAMVVP
ncbi:MAG: hypothetical protein PW786_05175 [Arachidicoccus sp.]|nr:hypothetical protein [Arachidicoccus sp.]